MPPTAPIAILLVEDETLIRMIAADTLIDAGFRVIEAGDAAEAIVLLEARPDARILVTDVKMPGDIDGFGLARIVAKRWSYVGIIITSGHALPGDGDVPDGTIFLAKPYAPSALLKHVLELAARARDDDRPATIDPEAAVVAPDEASAAETLIDPGAEPAAAVEPDADRSATP